MPSPRRAHRSLPSLFCLTLVAALAAQNSAGALPAAWLKNVKPLVQVRSARTRNISAARERHSLYFGDIIRTGPRSKANIMFSNGTQVAVRENSQIQIVAPQSSTSGLGIRLMAVLSGVWAKPKGPFQVRTAAAIAAARSTEYLVEMPTADTTIVTVVEGSVDFFNPQGSILVNANQQSTAVVGQAPTPPVAVDVTGLMAWTADITGLPVEFETPFQSLDPVTQQKLKVRWLEAVRANPNDATARRGLGEVYYDAGEYASAAEAFEAAVRLAPQDSTSHYNLGQARRGQGDIPGAIAAYQQALQLSPEAAAPRRGLSLAYLAQGNHQQVRDTLPGMEADAMANAILGLVELREGDDAEAIRLLQTAAAQNPQLYQAQALLALAYLTQNQVEQARQAVEKAVLQEENSAQTQGTRSMVLFFAGHTKEATRAAQRAVQLNPFSPFAQLTRGRVLLSQLKTDAARDAYQQAQALSPDLPIIHTELGAVYLRLDMLPKAEQAYRRAIEINANSASAHSGLGVALHRQGQQREALAELLRAVELEPRNAWARSNLANYYVEEGNLDQARLVLSECTGNDPECGIAYVRLSEISLMQQKLHAAQEFARHAVQLLPNSALAHYQLGRVYLEQERIVQAEQEFRQAVRLDRQFAAARYALGLTREKTERIFLESALSTSGPVTLGSAGSSLTLQNLQTPGAEDRIQAVLQDPTVVRVASRSFGNTQLDGLLGEQGTRNFDVSHLQESDDRRGVWGLTGERQDTDGVRDNADRTFDKASVVLGRKKQDNPSGFFLMGEFERQDEGLDRGLTPDPNARTRRFGYKLPRLLAGYNLQSNERSRTRLLLQGSQLKQKGTDRAQPNFLEDFEDHSFDGELRHDRQIGDRHWLSAGFSTGKRTRQTESTFPLPFPPFRFHSTTDTTARLYQAYVRDEMRVSERLLLTGEMQVQKLDYLNKSDILSPPLPPPFNSQATNRSSTRGVPAFIADYRPTMRSGLRFRARRLVATIRDFQLLSPTDVFLLSFAGLPHPQLVHPLEDGRSLEAEYDYTFRNSSFLRLGVFHQDLGQADTHSTTKLRGARLSYEGLAGRDLAFFVRADCNDAKHREERPDGSLAPSRFVAQVPRFAALAGLQYLNPRGYFAQSILAYQGSRFESNAADSRRLGGFGIVNLRAGKRTGLRSSLFVELHNVFDKTYEIRGVLQPDRQFRVGATRRF